MKTVSLELAKSLKEAGFPQDSRNVWASFKSKYPHHVGLRGNGYIAMTQVNEAGEDIGLNVLPESEYKVIIAAPTAEEMLDTLPMGTRTGHRLEVGKTGNGKTYFVLYRKDQFEPEPDIYGKNANWLNITENTSLAEAAGKMFLHLKREGLI